MDFRWVTKETRTHLAMRVCQIIYYLFSEHPLGASHSAKCRGDVSSRSRPPLPPTPPHASSVPLQAGGRGAEDKACRGEVKGFRS